MDQLTMETKTWIKQQSQTLFPELFDDNNATAKMDVFTTNAWIKNKRYKDYVGDDEMKQLLLFFTAHLLAQSESADGDANSVHLNDLSVSFSSNVSNGSDPYVTQYTELLHSLNLGNWGIDIS